MGDGDEEVIGLANTQIDEVSRSEAWGLLTDADVLTIEEHFDHRRPVAVYDLNVIAMLYDSHLLSDFSDGEGHTYVLNELLCPISIIKESND